jgi:hypothetical protein
MHVLPGMQGNNIWMVRQLSRLREQQGRSAEAEALRAEAEAMAKESVRAMYGTSVDGIHGWWNVIWPVQQTDQPDQTDLEGKNHTKKEKGWLNEAAEQQGQAVRKTPICATFTTTDQFAKTGSGYT